MKKTLNKNELIKKICFIIVGIYVFCVFINQQKTLDSYTMSQKYYKEQINEKLAYQQTLKETESNIDSEEYIEKIAREKLDMYLPNEKVYIDKSN